MFTVRRNNRTEQNRTAMEECINPIPYLVFAWKPLIQSFDENVCMNENYGLTVHTIS
jgi:hypothetical protein